MLPADKWRFSCLAVGALVVVFQIILEDILYIFQGEVLRPISLPITSMAREGAPNVFIEWREESFSFSCKM